MHLAGHTSHLEELLHRVIGLGNACLQFLHNENLVTQQHVERPMMVGSTVSVTR